MKCPAWDCGRDKPQDHLTEGQKKVIADADPGMLVAHLVRCSYCQAVYSSYDRRVLGWLDNSIMGQGWRPAHDR